ncbi:MAG: hypothetical protein H6Q85_3207 [candidate division NC10 bacterium]|nr:hypothetical protein [candidate division NC10 bacterium]
MSEFPIIDLNRVRRVPKRGQYDKDTIYRILDEGLVCHVGLVEDGQPVVIPMKQEKRVALEVLTEHILPGRWQDARRPNRQELDATAVVSVAIESASAKVRTGPPADDEDDYQLPVWAGVLPIQQQALTPVNDPRLRKDIPLPSSVSNYRRAR